jgi:lipopolysaccharide biosynthesis protein
VYGKHSTIAKKSLLMNRICIFAHYDRDNTIDDYVIYYLESLKTVASKLIFVTTSKIDPNDLRLKALCDEVIVRDNTGYDFVSWKKGLDGISDLSDFDELIICNDSVYGPLYPLNPIFEKMTSHDCDFWGMTQSNDIAFHLQSYFLVFKKKVIYSKPFMDFWKTMQIEKDKKEIIRKYEVGLTQTLVSAGFRSCAYASLSLFSPKMVDVMLRAALKKPVRAINKIYKILRKKSTQNVISFNPSILAWKELIADCKMPFIKVELLRDNPTGISTKGYEDIIRKHCNYDIKLIRNHLERIRKSDY